MPGCRTPIRSKGKQRVGAVFCGIRSIETQTAVIFLPSLYPLDTNSNFTINSRLLRRIKTPLPPVTCRGQVVRSNTVNHHHPPSAPAAACFKPTQSRTGAANFTPFIARVPPPNVKHSTPELGRRVSARDRFTERNGQNSYVNLADVCYIVPAVARPSNDIPP
jgi:hypothetical protein